MRPHDRASRKEAAMDKTNDEMSYTDALKIAIDVLADKEAESTVQHNRELEKKYRNATKALLAMAHKAAPDLSYSVDDYAVNAFRLALSKKLEAGLKKLQAEFRALDNQPKV